jgi:hypothetical protein
MNERIRELAEQACEKTQDEFQEDWDGTPRQVWDRKFQEKFAELIVRECARVAIAKQTENDIAGIVSKNPAKDFAYALVEHFGVEE